MEKYEKPAMEVVEIEEEVSTFLPCTGQGTSDKDASNPLG